MYITLQDGGPDQGIEQQPQDGSTDLPSFSRQPDASGRTLLLLSLVRIVAQMRANHTVGARVIRRSRVKVFKEQGEVRPQEGIDTFFLPPDGRVFNNHGL